MISKIAAKMTAKSNSFRQYFRPFTTHFLSQTDCQVRPQYLKTRSQNTKSSPRPGQVVRDVLGPTCRQGRTALRGRCRGRQVIYLRPAY